MGDLQVSSYDGTAAEALAGQLVDVFAVVWGRPPYTGNPNFSPVLFAERLGQAMKMDGFEVVTGHLDGRLVGYAYGITMPADWPSWVSLGDARPQELQDAARAGQVYWLRELMVLPGQAGRGFGRQLHDQALERRAEAWTALHCIVGNEPAYSMYLRWGYQVLGREQGGPGGPIYDVMVLPSPS